MTISQKWEHSRNRISGWVSWKNPVPMFSLALSGVFVLLMSGMILFETSRIIHGGETNYILATVNLFVALYNLFLSLLNILAAFAGER